MIEVEYWGCKDCDAVWSGKKECCPCCNSANMVRAVLHDGQFIELKESHTSHRTLFARQRRTKAQAQEKPAQFAGLKRGEEGE